MEPDDLADDLADPPDLRMRLARWVRPSPAEVLGLAMLLLGSVALSLMLWWQATARPGPAELVWDGADPTASTTDPWAAPSPEELAVPAPGGPLAGGAHGSVEVAVREDAEVIVHVSGAVARPGLVTLPAGSRVADALEAVGGGDAGAQLHLVNLARPLVDGEQLHVPREGEGPPPESTLPADAADVGSGPVDLNRASHASLETLPGIGPARAAEIVRHRERHGPFRVPGDLRDVPGIGEATFQRLAELVTVG